MIDKIATLEKMFIEGILGRADDDLKRAVNAKVAECLMFNDIPPQGGEDSTRT